MIDEVVVTMKNENSFKKMTLLLRTMALLEATIDNKYYV